MDTKTIAYLALGLGAAFALGLFGGSGEKKFTLPSGQVVNESQLPGLGYSLIQGQWVKTSQLNQINNQFLPNSQAWLRALQDLLNTGLEIKNDIDALCLRGKIVSPFGDGKMYCERPLGTQCAGGRIFVGATYCPI